MFAKIKTNVLLSDRNKIENNASMMNGVAIINGLNRRESADFETMGESGTCLRESGNGKSQTAMPTPPTPTSYTRESTSQKKGFRNCSIFENVQ
uniref:Uncharacterized protein n=1 Tax=Heterorhabditis bacteriophora TaxID=37862 RepID=A0A1I7XJD5_HETBA